MTEKRFQSLAQLIKAGMATRDERNRSSMKIIELPRGIHSAIGGHLFHPETGLTDNEVAAMALREFLLWWAT
jgi:hypothetical protein